MGKLKKQKIFLIDAIGAVASILFLFCLYSFEEFFGMPKSVLSIFICIAIVFSIYSATIYFTNPLNWKFYLKIIASLNISYCLFTIYHIYMNFENLTSFGYIYFIAEILIISILSGCELKLTRKAKKQQ